jgi:hypothetical protein
MQDIILDFLIIVFIIAISGRIRQMIDKIVLERSKGNETIKKTTHAKLALKGLDVDRYDSFSPDDPAVIARLQEIAKEMGVNL